MVSTTAAQEISSPIAGDDADDASVLQNQVFRARFADFQIGNLAQRRLHRCAIKRAVGLGARPAHRRAFAAIEQTKLDARRIRDPAHQAVQRIDLAHQMAFADAADGGIAGHLAQGGEFVGQQQGAGAGPRRSRRGFAAGMAAADHNDIKAVMRGPIRASQ